MDIKQQVKNAIVKAVPEIMELKFGCELLGKVKGSTKETIIKFDERMTYSVESLPHILATSEREFLNFQTTEILGRPITLEDVLRAINDKDWITVDTEGYFHEFETTRDEAGEELVYTKTRVQYQLGKPLDQQSDKVFEFLGSLLLKKGK